MRRQPNDDVLEEGVAHLLSVHGREIRLSGIACCSSTQDFNFSRSTGKRARASLGAAIK